MGKACIAVAFARRAWPVLAGFLLVVLAGCRCPRAVHTYEYLSDYSEMVAEYEPLVSLVRVPEQTDLSAYRGVVIGPIEVGEEWVESRPEAISYATFMRVVLRNELAKLERFQFVEFDSLSDDADETLAGALRIDGKITKFDMGSGFMRYMSYFLWFLQSGATDLQIEGRITEADTGDVLVEFADRRRHLGNTPYGPNPANFRHGFAMHVTAKQAATCLARFIDAACEGLPATSAPEPTRLAADTSEP